MSTTADDPRRHLLTRSDLVRLEVPDARVDEWLAAGSVEQVGALPADGGAEPVFAVHAVDLRAELHELLVALGKANAALGPVQARSQLLRALLAARGIDDGDTAVTEVDTGASQPPPDHEQLDDPVVRTMDNVSRAMAELLEAAAEQPPTPAEERVEAGGTAPPFGDIDTAVVLIEDDESASEEQMDEVATERTPADDRELEVLFEEPAGGEIPGDRAGDNDFATDTGPAFDDSGDAFEESPAAPESPAEAAPPAPAPDPTATEPDFFAERRDGDSGVVPPGTEPERTPAPASPTAIGNDIVVESLQQIHLALLALAERPRPAPDLQTVAIAIERGLRELRDAVAAGSAATALDARFEGLTAAITSGNAALIEVLAAQRQSPPSVGALAPSPARPRDGAATALAPWLLLAIGWSGALWLHTGDLRTALLALVGAIALGCPALLLLQRRQR